MVLPRSHLWATPQKLLRKGAVCQDSPISGPGPFPWHSLHGYYEQRLWPFRLTFVPKKRKHQADYRLVLEPWDHDPPRRALRVTHRGEAGPTCPGTHPRSWGHGGRAPGGGGRRRGAGRETTWSHGHCWWVWVAQSRCRRGRGDRWRRWQWQWQRRGCWGSACPQARSGCWEEKKSFRNTGETADGLSRGFH